jgi:protein CpxP
MRFDLLYIPCMLALRRVIKMTALPHHMESAMSKITKLRQGLGVAALLAVLATPTVQAMPGGGMMGGHHGGGPGGPRVEHMLDLVDASDSQRQQIQQIMKDAAQDSRAQRESLQQLHQQGRKLFTAATLDTAAIESLRQQTQLIHEQLSRRMSQAMLAAAQVLTPEQRAKMGERMAQRDARRAERKHQHEPARGSNAKAP